MQQSTACRICRKEGDSLLGFFGGGKGDGRGGPGPLGCRLPRQHGWRLLHHSLLHQGPFSSELTVQYKVVLEVPMNWYGICDWPCRGGVNSC